MDTDLPAEITCIECGGPVVVNSDGTANHLQGDDIETDHDADADHAPVPETDDYDPGFDPTPRATLAHPIHEADCPRGEMHEHRYSVTECPKCGHALTAESGVTIESYREGVGHGLVPSRLDEAGLLEDAFNLVEAGLHSDTICGKCGESLAEYETDEN